MTDAVSADEKVRDYLVRNGDDLSFTKYFWKECEPLESDLRQYRKLVAAFKMSHNGNLQSTIAKELGVSKETVGTWIRLHKLPKLGHFLKAFLNLGAPNGQRVWLNTECTHGHAIPIGRFIRVPLQIEGWRDIDDTLSQLEQLPGTVTELDKRYLFGFLLGMMIGDAAKSKQKTFHRHIDLTLSMKYGTNLKLGEFTSLCAQSIGLRMHRIKDRVRSSNKPYGFFEWTSQSSPLIDWICNVALELRDDELTTYDPIHAGWVVDAPREFRVGLVQGLAESDGSPNIANQSVEFWIGPNWDWMKSLLASLGLRAFRCRDAVSIVKSQAVKAFTIPIFAGHLKTIRYSRLELLATSRRLRREERLPTELREQIMNLARSGFSVPKIVERTAQTAGILVSFEAAQRWANRGRQYLNQK